MERFKTYGCLILGLMACVTFGAYITHTNYEISAVPTHSWVLTPLFGGWFISLFIKRVKEGKI
jgi:hypothetical protein